MGKALYRAYRPRSLDDAIGQEHITATLKQALKKDDISHAYLLTGPRGTGKTSIARILAHDINKLSYEGDDATHLDIIEIDAASNRRIDDIRDLRDKVHIAPTSAKYKVYIIDEVHMLTGESFNALLKTLEEPPAHVVFILATTEAHKVPQTILSRVQRFTFRPVALEKVVAHLKSIAEKEAISIDTPALQLIAEHGEGSFRDSISLLDQMRGQAGKKITSLQVREFLGIPADETIDSILSSIALHDSQQLIADILDLQLHGHDAARIAKQLAKVLREQLVTGKRTLSTKIITELLTKLLDIPSSAQPFRLLEIILLSQCFDNALPTEPTPTRTPHVSKTVATTAALQEPIATQPVVTATVTISEPPNPIESKKQPAKVALKEPETTLEPAPAKTYAVGSVDPEIWTQVLNEVKKKYNTLYGIARMAVVTPTDNGLQLGFKFAFHQKRVNEAKNKTIIIETIEQLTGVTIVLDCIVVESAIAAGKDSFDDAPLPPEPEAGFAAEQPPAEPPKPAFNALSDISNIFGGGEVLES